MVAVRTVEKRDTGSWGEIPDDVASAWKPLADGFDRLVDKHQFLKNTNSIRKYLEVF